MFNTVDVDLLLLIINPIQNSIISEPDTIAIFPYQFLAPMRARVYLQFQDSLFEALIDFFRKFITIFLSRGDDEKSVISVGHDRTREREWPIFLVV